MAVEVVDRDRELSYTAREYLRKIVEDKVNIVKELIRWDDKDYEEYNRLLAAVKIAQPINESKKEKKGQKKPLPDGGSTEEKGKSLEQLAEFIIKKTFFFQVHRNIHTPTNEIDLVVCLSDVGKEAMHTYNISRELIPIPEDRFLGECKNYKTNVGVSWVGKFYGLLNTCSCNFGILFSNKGLTGEEDGWHDSYGLIRVFSLIERYRNNRKFYIIEFNMKEYEDIAKGASFFELIKAKIEGISLATTYEELLKDNRHESEQDILTAMQSVEIKI